MNKFFLWIAAALAVVVQSCEKTDGIRDEIESLKDRVAALEAKIPIVNQSILALHRLMDESTVIVGKTQTADGYVLELSDGTKLPVVLGADIPALVPKMGIDKEGYWTVSLDGVTFKRLTVGGEYVSAFPRLDGEPSEDAEGVTPMLRVDADGYWEVSVDKGVTYVPLLQDDKPVGAVGGKNPIKYSEFFKAVSYNETTGLLSVELLTGETLTLPVEDTFGITVTVGAAEKILLGETRAFEVVQRNVSEARVTATSGWIVKLEENQLLVTAPATYTAGKAEGVISVTVVSNKGYRKGVTIKLMLQNAQVDANASAAWKKFVAAAADNVLLDYSYAGYKHGEEAPADVWGLGYKIYDMTKYGADPTGATSSRAAFLAVLEELRLANVTNPNANARAVIYFPQGRYILHNDDDNTYDASSSNTAVDSKGNNVSNEILIRGGNFVIKGEGRDKTVLVMDTPNLPKNPADMWTSPTMINIKHNSGLSKLSDVTANAARGTFSVQVGSAVGINPGDWVCLQLSNNDPVLVAQELAPHVVEGNMTDIKTILVEDFHQVKSVNGTTVTFAEPLMYGVEAKWGWTVQKFPHYENIGIEDLAFEGRSKADFNHHSSWMDDGAYKPLNMMRLTDSWIRRVDFRSVSEALSIVTSANCSAYDIEISGNRGHSAVRSQGSSRVFIGKVVDRSVGKAVLPPGGSGLGAYMDNAGQYHASGVSNTSLGAVLWNNVWGDDAFFESHSKQPRATLVDRCRGGFVQWRFGGDEGNVPNHLGDLTIWNLDATRAAHDFGAAPFKWWLSSDKWWKTMPPIIVGFHGAAVNFDTSADQIKYLESNGTAVEPQSLYEAQLRKRLGYVPGWLNSLK